MPNITAPSDLINIFQNVAGGWLANGQSWGRALFAVFAGVELTWFGMTMFRQRHEFDTAMREFLFKGIAVAFFATLLFTAPGWVQLAMDTFINYGKQISGVGSLAPSTIFGLGINIAGSLIASAEKAGLHLQIGTAIGFYIAAFFIFAGFVAITYQFVIATIEAYFAVGFASFWLGFGGSSWTIPYVERYFSLLVGCGVRLIATYATIGMGLQISSQWKTIAKNIGGSGSGIETGWIIAGAAVIYAGICWHAPKWISGHLAGSPSLSASDVHGGLVTAFTAMTSGAAAVATIGGSAAVAGGARAVTAGASASGAAMGGGGNGGGPTPQPPSSGGGPSGPAPQPPSSGSHVASTAMTALRGAAQTLRSVPNSGSNGSGPRIGIGHN